MRALLIVCHTTHALLIITHSLYGCALSAHAPFTGVLHPKELASLPTSVPMPFTNKAPLTKQANNHSSHDADHGKGPLGPETSSMILNPWGVRATLQMSITLAKATAKLSIGFFGHRSRTLSHSGKRPFRSLSHRVPTMLFGWRVLLLFLSCAMGVRKYNTNHSLCVYEVQSVCTCVFLFVGCKNEWPQCPEIAISTSQCVARSQWEGWSDLCMSHKEKERGELKGVGSRWKDKMSLCDPEIKRGKRKSRFKIRDFEMLPTTQILLHYFRYSRAGWSGWGLGKEKFTSFLPKQMYVFMLLSSFCMLSCNHYMLYSYLTHYHHINQSHHIQYVNTTTLQWSMLTK